MFLTQVPIIMSKSERTKQEFSADQPNGLGLAVCMGRYLQVGLGCFVSSLCLFSFPSEGPTAGGCLLVASARCGGRIVCRHGCKGLLSVRPAPLPGPPVTAEGGRPLHSFSQRRASDGRSLMWRRSESAGGKTLAASVTNCPVHRRSGSTKGSIPSQCE